MSISPDEMMLASGGQDKVVKLWSMLTFEVLKELEGHEGPVRSVCFSSNSEILASGSDDRSISIWNVNTH